MYFDDRTGGWRPKKEYRGVRFTKWMWFWEMLYAASVYWALFALRKMGNGFEWSEFAGLSLPETPGFCQLVLDVSPIVLFVVTLIGVVALGVPVLHKILTDRQTARDLAEARARELAKRPADAMEVHWEETAPDQEIATLVEEAVELAAERHYNV